MPNFEGWKIRINRPIHKMGHDIFIFRKVYKTGEMEFLQSDGTVEIIKNDGYEKDIKPTIYLPEDLLQELVDIAGGQGIKPKQGFLEGKMEGTNKHLEDMRKLVFKK